jgi:transcriptional regulator with XRE-family HTH domain
MAAKDPMLARLGAYLRGVRERRGWSQEEMGYRARLHRTYVGAVERGEYNLTLLTLRRITDTLGVTMVEAVRSAATGTRPPPPRR